MVITIGLQKLAEVAVAWSKLEPSLAFHMETRSVGALRELSSKCIPDAMAKKKELETTLHEAFERLAPLDLSVGAAAVLVDATAKQQAITAVIAPLDNYLRALRFANRRLVDAANHKAKRLAGLDSSESDPIVSGRTRLLCVNGPNLGWDSSMQNMRLHAYLSAKLPIQFGEFAVCFWRKQCH